MERRNVRFAVGAVWMAFAGAALGQHAHDHAQHATSDQHEQEHAHRDGPTPSERAHIPPEPPRHPMGDMPNERMIEIMGMDDDAAYSMLRVDQLEWRDLERDPLVWDAQAYYGDDYDKLWWKSEGSYADGDYESSNELFWDRIVSRWWSTQLGIRHDASEGPSRSWAAFGIHGLAPYWFELEATLYVGEEGRTALRASAEQDWLLTQRLILQPEVELELYGKDDRANGIGSGLASAELGLRLRYEIRRELAPYLGVAWTRLYGETADLAEAAGHDADDVQLVAGLRVWF